jgi:hypothetical protein
MKNALSEPPAKFSAPRHRTIGSLAQSFLETNALKEVKKLLKNVSPQTLQKIATWADEIKPTIKNKPTDTETKKFLQKFPDTREWHFVDLPVNATSYDETLLAPFIPENDVVHTLIESINVLTGQSAKFSKPIALRWLVHLMGDIHQPLHIACSYIDYSKPKPELVFDPNDIISRNLLAKSDRGGNKILLPIGSQGKSLHSYWDGDIPKMDDNFDNETYNPPPPVPVNKLKNQPAIWVTDNLPFVKEAYNGLTVKGKNPTHATYVDVTFDKTKYDKRVTPIIKDLSIKAANRLAFILNTIYS